MDSADESFHPPHLAFVVTFRPQPVLVSGNAGVDDPLKTNKTLST